jgi:hypothetical protein
MFWVIDLNSESYENKKAESKYSLLKISLKIIQFILIRRKSAQTNSKIVHYNFKNYFVDIQSGDPDWPHGFTMIVSIRQ